MLSPWSRCSAARTEYRAETATAVAAMAAGGRSANSLGPFIRITGARHSVATRSAQSIASAVQTQNAGTAYPREAASDSSSDIGRNFIPLLP